ncbi:hypothetical protein C1H46_004407 [Malus baccata]|uniref:ABC transmembrane type-1 domain-containing protein n=1 Tax=Malus baccata TaxID=106549 RepID=A0A540NG10_MALBA|nr:hypothetical protein C1H46_004407 [Malus baccata]
MSTTSRSGCNWMMRRRERSKDVESSPGRCAAASGSTVPPPVPPATEKQREVPKLRPLLRRFWKVAAPYWSSDDKVQARIRLAVVFALTLATTGISVCFNFLGRDFYNAIADKNQKQFTKQLLYYLAAFAGGIPIFVLRYYARQTLSLRWRAWMTKYYLDRYLSNQTFYKIQSQSIIDNPDQRIVDDLNSFTEIALYFSVTLFSAVIDLISFNNILFSIYPPLFVVLFVYSIGGTVISIFLGKNLVSLNFMQEKKEADFRYGLVRVRENAESIAFYSGEANEMQLLLQRFTSAFINMSKLLICSRNLEFFTSGYSYLIQIIPAAVVAPMYFSGKIAFGVINQSVSAFSHILADLSLIVYQFQTISAFAAVIDRLGSLPFSKQVPKSEHTSEKPSKPTTEDLIQVLEDVRLGNLLSRFSSLDTSNDWSSVLSLGEQQRLAFARLLLSKPQLVLLDESTSALDEANEVHLYQQIEKAGITYISVGHRQTLYDFHKKNLRISTEEPSSAEPNWSIESINRETV